MAEKWNPYESPRTQTAQPSKLDKKWARWRRTRERGRQRFVWVNGVLGWGLITGVIWSIWMAFSQGWDRWLAFFLGGIIFFPIGGYFWGAWMWSTMENNYKKECEESEPS